MEITNSRIIQTIGTIKLGILLCYVELCMLCIKEEEAPLPIFFLQGLDIIKAL